MIFEVTEFSGMSQIIHKEKMPPYVFQVLRNYVPGKKLGALVKRNGYANILTSGLGSYIVNIIEFTDKNGTRQLVIVYDDGGTKYIKESIYSAGYQALTVLLNYRTSGSTINTFFPVLHDNIIRSGSGLNASTDRPVWYGYLDAVTLFPRSGLATYPISAGKYLCDQFPNFADAIFSIEISEVASPVTTAGLSAGKYYVYLSPVWDGYQKGFPVLHKATSFEVTTDNYTMMIVIRLNQNSDCLTRLRAIDVFVASVDNYGYQDSNLYPAYFLQRLPLDDASDPIYEGSGDCNSGAGTVDLGTAANWLTCDPDGMRLYNVDQDEYYLITAHTGGVMDVSPAPTATQTDTIRLLADWDNGSFSRQKIVTFYDNYYLKLGSEMYEYLNIPAGDFGLSDKRYKYGAMAGQRFFAIYDTDKKGHYSAPGAPDVIPSMNELTFKHTPIGCTDVGEDVIIFSRHGMERISVYGNTQMRQDDNFSDSGIAGEKAFFKINDYEIFGMDYAGPWYLRDKSIQRIGDELSDWWDDISAAEKETCVVSYDRINYRVLFSFPNYSDATYTAGIVFVFDLRYYKRTGRSAWWILHSDTKILCAANASDNHLLTGGTKIVDWNNSSADETVAGLVKLKLLRSPVAGSRRMQFEKIAISHDTDDTVTLNCYFDGSPVAIVLSGDGDAYLRYIAETMEIEISTAASANAVEITHIQTEFRGIYG